MPLGVGETFAGYQILRQLGSGGMGEVYLVQHPRLPRQEALKVLRPDISSDTEFRERFIREADLAAGLRHPHIVGVHDRGEHDGQLWISMDYIGGTDLAHLIAQRYPAGMPAAQGVPVIVAVAGALDYAHKKGLLHRDVKPANIIVADLDTDDPSIFLADFGIARPLDDTDGLTTTNMTVGTVAYAAPEQLMGETIDGCADQYALAATAYHLLTGRALFPHSNPAVVISRHLNSDPAPIATLRPDLASADSVFAAALAKDPADRFARCSDFAQALREQLVHTTGVAPTTPTPAARAAPTSAAPPLLAATAIRGQSVKPIGGQQITTSTDQQRRSATIWKPLVAGTLLIAVAFVAVALVWRPWRMDATSTHEANPNSASLSPSASTSAAATAQSTSVSLAPVPPPTTTTTNVVADQYNYALPACYFDGPPTPRPESIGFQTCADGSRRLESMSWSAWDSAGAQGTGVFSFQVCEPSCAEGHRASYQVNVAAFNPRPAGYNSGCPSDTLFYSEMVLSFPASAPEFADTTYLGRPAIRFTTNPDTSGGQSLGNQLCY